MILRKYYKIYTTASLVQLNPPLIFCHDTQEPNTRNFMMDGLQSLIYC